jgi:hypothetical protein
LALLLAVCVTAPGADRPTPDRKRNEPQRLLRVPLLVTSGDPLREPSDVKVSLYNGPALRVVRLQAPASDLLVLLVLDLTGDIALVDPARAALVDQIAALPPSTWIGVLRAQDGLTVLQDPTPDRDAVTKALEAVALTGRAGLLDTIETAAQLAESITVKSAVRLAILYITDSDVRNYREDFTNPVINSSDSRDLSRRFPEGLIREKISKLTEKLGKYEAPVFIVHLSYSSERLNEAYQGGLRQIATATGGTATFCRSIAEIPGAIRQAVDSIQALHQLVIQLPPKTPKSLTLVLDSDGRQLSYRSRFLLH